MAIGALSVVSLLLWFLYPFLNLATQDVTQYNLFNQTDPINALSLSLANSFFLILGLVGFLVVGFILYTEAVKGGGGL